MKRCANSFAWRTIGTRPLADLPWRYSRIQSPYSWNPMERDYFGSDYLLAWYLDWALTKIWAWEGLVKLTSRFMDRREPIPRPLVNWSLQVATGKLQSPDLRGRPEEDNRNDRIVYAHRLLRADGLTAHEATERIALVIFRSPESVKSAIHKVKKDHPPTIKRSRYGYSLASMGPPQGVQEYNYYCLGRSGSAICY